MYMCLAQGGVGGKWIRGLGLGFTNPVEIGGVLDVGLCLGCSSVDGEWVGRLVQGVQRWGGVMPVCVVSLESMCIWQVQVSVYCARRVPDWGVTLERIPPSSFFDYFIDILYHKYTMLLWI